MKKHKVPCRRFNRDIVECKGVSYSDRPRHRQCFNRDIVECKVARIAHRACIICVLIET